MKPILLLFFLITLHISCSKSDSIRSTNLIGKWKLIEVLSDPGDGSGTFKSVNSKKEVVFYNDGTVTSNGFICNNSVESNLSSIGTYSIKDFTIDSQDCSISTFLKTRFRIESNLLLINYPSDEASSAKYIKK